ncbi:MAG TPA: BON domain-containing protein [Steroidobacteraceae bacterium]|jgi:osmotically-inducible protein OsmY
MKPPFKRSAGRAVCMMLAGLVCGCVSSAVQSPETSAADEALAARVYEALNADPIYYYRHVDVHVDNGVAQLSGYIWSVNALTRAKQIAAGVPGVTTVVDQLELERNGNRGGGHAGTG